MTPPRPPSGRPLPPIEAGCVLALLLLPGGSAGRSDYVEPAAHHPDPPQVVFQDLFAQVQTRRLYPDSKVFPDAIPRAAPPKILARYRALHSPSTQMLMDFVGAHFSLPTTAPEAPAPAAGVDLVARIDGLWDSLTRNTRTAPRYSSLLALPRPYVVPGGRFREIYYWDSYFTMLGLRESGRRDLIDGMVRDFAFLIDRYGHVPNGTRTYYLTRSQPPFFFEMVGLESQDGPGAAYAGYLPQLRREYAFWMSGSAGLKPGHARRRVVALPDGSILNRYWDDSDAPRDESYAEDVDLAHRSGRPARALYRELRAAAESGWDFSSRWLADGHTLATIETTHLVPIDLNSLMFGLENAIRMGCERRLDLTCARDFASKSAARRGAIDRYLWDARAGAYFDYRWTDGSRVARVSAATLYPAFVGLSSESQAAAVAATARSQLLEAGGIVTTPLDTGQQWDAPNGWAPLQWIAVAGMRRYGATALAQQIACRWAGTVEAVYRHDAKLVEKYDVTRSDRAGGGGEYPLQDGFGWTNGVMRALIALYPSDADVTRSDGC